MGIWDVEKLKKRITRKQLQKWFAFYRIEPWGQPWLMAGRMTSLIRHAFTGKYDHHDEERFLITYRPGDEYRSKVPPTEHEIAEKLATLPGMKRWQRSEKSPRSSRHPRPGS